MAKIEQKRMFTLNCKGTILSLQKPLVMGIINVNNDSFFSGNRKSTVDEVLLLAEKMIKEGATILDLGGQSTSPKSVLIGAEEEKNRVVPVIEKLASCFPDVCISVDTFYASVAKAAVDTGASIVNDISAGKLDNMMLPTVGSLNVPFIAMHMKGTPQTMQSLTQYHNLLSEVINYFVERIDACYKAGIKDVIIDPGFGFAKTVEQNFTLFSQLEAFTIFDNPLLVGISRKSMIYKYLNISAAEALNGSTVMHTIALQKGVNIIRTHDVKEAVETIKLLDAMEQY